MKGVCFANLSPYLTELADILNKHHYKPAHIHNMDETGFAIGTTQSTRVMLVERGEKTLGKAVKAGSERGEWTTMVECVAADGSTLPPLVILKGKASFNSSWLPNSLTVKGWVRTTSAKGWTNNHLALKWLKRVFIPKTD